MQTAVLAITVMITLLSQAVSTFPSAQIMAFDFVVGGTILKNNQAVPGVVIILVSIAVGIVCGFINGTFWFVN